MNELGLEVVDVWKRPSRFVDLRADGVDASEDDEAEEDDDDFPGGRELLIAIDGRLELQRWGGLGREPDDLLNPEMPLLPPADGTPRDVRVQRCGCGVVGCGSLTATITRRGDLVEWSRLREGERVFPIGPFTFDAAAYEATIRHAHEHRPWEGRAERIARLVTEQLAVERRARPLAFTFASGRDRSDVIVSYLEYRPNPRAGERTPIRGDDGEPGWFAVEPDELIEQHIGGFPLGDGDDESEVAAIIRAVRETPPRRWTRPPDLPIHI